MTPLRPLSAALGALKTRRQYFGLPKYGLAVQRANPKNLSLMEREASFWGPFGVGGPFGGCIRHFTCDFRITSTTRFWPQRICQAATWQARASAITHVPRTAPEAFGQVDAWCALVSDAAVTHTWHLECPAVTNRLASALSPGGGPEASEKPARAGSEARYGLHPALLRRHLWWPAGLAPCVPPLYDQVAFLLEHDSCCPGPGLGPGAGHVPLFWQAGWTLGG